QVKEVFGDDQLLVEGMAPQPDPPTSANGVIVPTSTTTVQDAILSGTILPSALPTAPSTGGGNNMLYLFTFLTTLLLLLGVSCAIIARSVMHRRRYRRRVEEALARGLPLPPDLVQETQEAEANLQLVLTGRTRRRKRRPPLGPKPVLWEVSLDDDKGRDDWVGILPVSTTVVHPLPDAPLTPISQPTEEFTMTRWEAFKLVMNSATNIISPRPPTPRLPQQPPLTPSNIPATSGIVMTQPTPLSSLRPPPPPPPLKIEDDDAVMVGFVIAMPDPSRPLHRRTAPQPSSSSASIEEITEQSKGKSRDASTPLTFARDDDELPEIAFAVTDVRWRNASKSLSRGPKESFDSSTSE
ncbi:hypothetical protein FRC01_010759, partial [Tulasnella sp. 417]